jgi:hypothetical protein
MSTTNWARRRSVSAARGQAGRFFFSARCDRPDLLAANRPACRSRGLRRHRRRSHHAAVAVPGGVIGSPSADHALPRQGRPVVAMIGTSLLAAPPEVLLAGERTMPTLAARPGPWGAQRRRRNVQLRKREGWRRLALAATAPRAGRARAGERNPASTTKTASQGFLSIAGLPHAGRRRSWAARRRVQRPPVAAVRQRETADRHRPAHNHVMNGFSRRGWSAPPSTGSPIGTYRSERSAVDRGIGHRMPALYVRFSGYSVSTSCRCG